MNGWGGLGLLAIAGGTVGTLAAGCNSVSLASDLCVLEDELGGAGPTEPAEEICDGVDNDGDGDTDEGFTADIDEDGILDCLDTECTVQPVDLSPTATICPEANLVPSVGDICSASCASNGRSKVVVKITNSGETAVPAGVEAEIIYWFVPAAIKRYTLVTTTTLEPGQSEQIVHETTAELLRYRVGVVADPTETVAECDEEDNVFQTPGFIPPGPCEWHHYD